MDAKIKGALLFLSFEEVGNLKINFVGFLILHTTVYNDIYKFPNRYVVSYLHYLLSNDSDSGVGPTSSILNRTSPRAATSSSEFRAPRGEYEVVQLPVLIYV